MASEYANLNVTALKIAILWRTSAEVIQKVIVTSAMKMKTAAMEQAAMAIIVSHQEPAQQERIR